jgi:hypothetical protein
MAMAIHSAKLFSEIFIESKNTGQTRKTIEARYASNWQASFSGRLRAGMLIQKMLLKPMATQVGFKVAKVIPGMLPMVIKQTHGALLI